MKQIIKLFAIIGSLLVLFSCDLDFKPENTMVDETVYKDANTAEAALLGAYSRMNAAYSGAPTGVNNYSNVGNMMLFGEIGTPTVKLRENASYLGMETSDYTSSDHEGYILDMWRIVYNAIDYTNNIIVNINKYGKYDPAIMQQHIAEAKFLRAYEYLLLLQSFGDGALVGKMDGLGAILRLTPYDGYNPNQIETRASVGATYERIILDLEEALPYLSDEAASTLNHRIRASKSSAYALLSRVYLYKSTFTNDIEGLKLAANYADSVLTKSQELQYTFSTSHSHMTGTMFPYNATGEETNPATYSNEVLFLSPCYTSDVKYSNGVGNNYFNKRNFFVDEEFLKEYPLGDKRGYVDEKAGSGLVWQGSDTYYPSDKTSFKFNNGEGYNNVIYLRLSEIMLTRAEALARVNGVNEESIKYLNDINKRNYQTKPTDYTVSDFSSGEALVNRILKERMKELAFEGHSRFDLIRTNRPLRESTIPSEKKILPIPDYEIKISQGIIEQNTGYR